MEDQLTKEGTWVAAFHPGRRNIQALINIGRPGIGHKHGDRNRSSLLVLNERFVDGLFGDWLDREDAL